MSSSIIEPFTVDIDNMLLVEIKDLQLKTDTKGDMCFEYEYEQIGVKGRPLYTDSDIDTKVDNFLKTLYKNVVLKYKE